MNNLTLLENNNTFTSEVLAKKLHRQHAHMLRDIDKMMENTDYPNLDSQYFPSFCQYLLTYEHVVYEVSLLKPHL